MVEMCADDFTIVQNAVEDTSSVENYDNSGEADEKNWPPFEWKISESKYFVIIFAYLEADEGEGVIRFIEFSERNFTEYTRYVSCFKMFSKLYSKLR